MDTDRHGLREGELTHAVIGAAMEVLNGLGHGLLEKPYENALCVEFGQMINYLRITGLPVGMILNFKRAKLEWKRVSL